MFWTGLTFSIPQLSVLLPASLSPPIVVTFMNRWVGTSGAVFTGFYRPIRLYQGRQRRLFHIVQQEFQRVSCQVIVTLYLCVWSKKWWKVLMKCSGNVEISVVQAFFVIFWHRSLSVKLTEQFGSDKTMTWWTSRSWGGNVISHSCGKTN